MYNWKQQREKNAFLALADGRRELPIVAESSALAATEAATASKSFSLVHVVFHL